MDLVTGVKNTLVAFVTTRYLPHYMQRTVHRAHAASVFLGELCELRTGCFTVKRHLDLLSYNISKNLAISAHPTYLYVEELIYVIHVLRRQTLHYSFIRKDYLTFTLSMTRECVVVFKKWHYTQ